jgi:hypothetical protein
MQAVSGQSHRAPRSACIGRRHRLHAQRLRHACAAGCGHAAIAAGLPHRHTLQRAPESTILKMRTPRVLARLRIRHDDFSIYQGYRRYADIVAGCAPNAQDARIFAT